jgi:1-acyl-sn-glycerol-3-phosphate acyltransferase
VTAVLPPRWVRRVLVAPAMVAITALILAVTPLVVLVLAFAVRFLKGRWRALRLFWFLLVYLVRESVGLFALLTLWIISGFGWKLRSPRFRAAHVVLIGWYLRGLIGSAARVLGLRLVGESVPDDLVLGGPAGGRRRPVLVFSRHAGAGDSFILVHLLVNTYGRNPRIVLKDLLQWDPCVDVILNRLPNRFISPDPPPGAGVVESITALAQDIDPEGALILFPEGGNFTARRHARAVEKLTEAGLLEAAERARGLVHLLPPRPGGAFAAIDASPDADILFVAHTGLEQLSSASDLWNGLPMDRDVRLTYWTVRRDEVPSDHDERMRWLFDWWERIDGWIEERRDPEHDTRPRVET